MKLVIIENDTVQYGPDSFEAIHRVLRVDEETTVGEIIQWWMRQHPRRWEGEGPFPTTLHLTGMADA